MAYNSLDIIPDKMYCRYTYETDVLGINQVAPLPGEKVKAGLSKVEG